MPLEDAKERFDDPTSNLISEPEREAQSDRDEFTNPHFNENKAIANHQRLIGSSVGNYEILEFLGEGGMSFVYKGRHRLLDRMVAIKILRQGALLDQAKLRRFHQEALAVHRLDHRNIVKMYEFDIPDDGEAFLVMDFIEGVSLAEFILEHGHLEMQDCQSIFSQLCEALDHAHKKGVVHRDIKPSNVMVCRSSDGIQVKIVDFGIAKLFIEDNSLQGVTRTGEVFGSPLYMSPEQCSGLPLDIRSDIYSVGCLFFEAISGEPPFSGSNSLHTMQMHLNDSPRILTSILPGLQNATRIESVLLKALAKDPNRRYQSMHDLNNDIQEAINPSNRGLLSNCQTHLHMLARRYKLKRSRNSPLLIFCAALSLMIVVAASINLLYSRNPYNQAKDQEGIVVHYPNASTRIIHLDIQGSPDRVTNPDGSSWVKINNHWNVERNGKLARMSLGVSVSLDSRNNVLVKNTNGDQQLYRADGSSQYEIHSAEGVSTLVEIQIDGAIQKIVCSDGNSYTNDRGRWSHTNKAGKTQLVGNVRLDNGKIIVTII